MTECGGIEGAVEMGVHCDRVLRSRDCRGVGARYGRGSKHMRFYNVEK